jgi:two-component system chemotaxis sensor kinase CheA
MTDTMDRFVEETEEELVSLSNSLLDLEREADEETVDEIFRTAHTVKGSFGAMGFGEASDIAHALEDVFDDVRSGDIEVTPDLIDRLFEGVDALEACLSEIEENGELTDSYDDVVKRVRELSEETDETGDAGGGTGEEPGAEAETEKVLIVTVSDEDFPGAAAVAALDDIEKQDDFDLIETIPDRDTIEEGGYEDSFQVVGRTEGGFGIDSSDIRKASSVTVVEDDVGAIETPDDAGKNEETKGDTDTEQGQEEASPSEVLIISTGGRYPGTPEETLGKVQELGLEVLTTEPDEDEFEKHDGKAHIIAESGSGREGALQEVGSVTVVEDEVGLLEVPGGDSEEPAGGTEEKETPGEDTDSDPVEETVVIEVDGGDFPGAAAVAALDDLREEVLSVVGTEPDTDALEAGDYEGSFVAEVETEPGFEIDSSDLRKATSVEVRDGSTGEGSEDEPEKEDEEVGDGTEKDPSQENEDEDEEAETKDEEDKGPPADQGGGTDDGDGDHEAIQSVRVDVEHLDEMMNNVSELVITKIQIQHAAESGDIEEIRKAADKLDKLSERLRDDVMEARLVPLKKITGRYPRVVRDVARESGKEVDFEVQGEEIELDRSILEDLKDPIVHLLKNAVDHGIEDPEDRIEAGKPRRGKVVLEAERFRDRVELRVRDDGSGIDPDKIRQKAVESGVVSESEAEGMQDSEVYDLTLESGFSTKEEVTDTSGRGVGMDAVKEAVQSNDGNISVSSTPGEGTVTTLTLPIDIAVVQALLVGVGERRYAVPTKTVDAIESGAEADLDTVRGERVCVVDGDPRPMLSLPKKFSADGGEETEGMFLHIRDSVREASIRCEEVYGQQEIVVQPFEGVLRDVKEFSGTAILGEGEVVPVIEVNQL